jgi:hypothetical protein
MMPASSYYMMLAVIADNPLLMLYQGLLLISKKGVVNLRRWQIYWVKPKMILCPRCQYLEK